MEAAVSVFFLVLLGVYVLSCRDAGIQTGLLPNVCLFSPAWAPITLGWNSADVACLGPELLSVA